MRPSQSAQSAASRHSREGQHFRVGNIGNNGLLYLRPIERQEQSLATPPSTPPESPSAGNDDLRDTARNHRGSLLSELPAAQTTSSGSLKRSATTSEGRTRYQSRSGTHTGRPFPASSAGMQEPSVTVVIDHAPQNSLSTANTANYQLLDVDIPHYRLGRPTFGRQGSATIQSVSSNGGFDSRNSLQPAFQQQQQQQQPQQPQQQEPSNLQTDMTPGFVRAPTPRNSSSKPRKKDIFARYPFKLVRHSHEDHGSSSSDNDGSVYRYRGKALVRLSGNHSHIVAATPSGIIIQITSPDTVDYELLSDFFFTFRSYISTSDLTRQLMARMERAVTGVDDDSRIIRVRTFVALRHWILNYFVEDFVSDYKLRLQFCASVNHLSHLLSLRQEVSDGNLTVLGELKKCWRREAGLYWDIPEHAQDNVDDHICPGGHVGSRDSSFDGDEAARNRPLPSANASQPVISSNIPPLANSGQKTSADAPPHRNIDHNSSVRMSEHSVIAYSCSVPLQLATRLRQRTQRQYDHPQTSKFVSIPGFVDLSAAPHHQVAPENEAQAMQFRRTQISPSDGHIFPGSVVRGWTVPPVSPTVHSSLQIGPAEQARPMAANQTTATQRSQSPGAGKFWGSIRHAVNNKQQQAQDPTSLSGHGISGSNTPEQRLSSPERRVDQLSADALKVFRNLAISNTPNLDTPGLALTSDMAVVPHQRSRSDSMVNVTAGHLGAPHWTSEVSTGSRSIFIIDDTNNRLPLRRGLSLRAERPGHHVYRIAPPQTDQTADEPAVEKELPTSYLLSPTASSHMGLDGGGPISSELERSGYSQLASSEPGRTEDLEGDSQVVGPNEVSMRGQGSEVENNLSSNSSTEPIHLENFPVPQLRRRPGGDLRAVDHVHSLEAIATSQKRQSSTSSRNSALSKEKTEEANAPLPRGISFLDTHSSQPALNASPEYVERLGELAKLPDYTFDGSRESALLMLEGRIPEGSTSAAPGSDVGFDEIWGTNFESQRADEARTSHPVHTTSTSTSVPPLTAQEQPSSIQSMPQTESPKTQRTHKHSVAMSEASYSSIPIFERNLSQRFQRNRNNSSADKKGLPPPLPNQPPPTFVALSRSQGADSKTAASAQSTENTYIDEAGSSHGKAIRTVRPKTSSTQPSFLLDENQSLSAPDQATSFYDPDRDSLPLDADDEPASEQAAVDVLQPPPAAALAATDTHTRKPFRKAKSAGDLQRLANVLSPNGVTGNHLPFIFDYDSSTLARHMTLVEKDALSQISWREMIELRWQKTNNAVLNWAEYICAWNSDQKLVTGVDLCTSRFNLMTKWASSEIVLAADINERVATILKYIHIAQHCRRIRNWATMYQITSALLSRDVARLKYTWSRVPEAEKRTLKSLETLITPTRNFAALRQEIGTADVAEGCIPFLALFMRDLEANAQKPPYVEGTTAAGDSDTGGEPFVNFERHHIAAGIVKDLIRRIDSSTRYEYEADAYCLSRCLWIAALPDAEIERRSRELEP